MKRKTTKKPPNRPRPREPRPAESLRDLTVRLGALTGAEVKGYGGRFAEWAADWPRGVTVLEMLVLSVFAEASQRPQAALFGALVKLLDVEEPPDVNGMWYQFKSPDLT